ncbi:hypothetical protein B0H13DRAFT_2494864 [Mycena leptocephala]|nr:hypothetical protein B0H13DRAFT_2494864 [Mycena leptocephala]
MSSVQLPPTLHLTLCIRPSMPSISHPSILSPAGSPAYYFLDTAVRTCAAEPQTPELATYDMARPPSFPCCDGYGLTLGIVGLWCVIFIITLLFHPVHLPLKLAQFCLRAPLASTLVLRILFVGFLAAQSDALARAYPQLPRSSSPSPITSHLALAASLKLNTTLGAYIPHYSQRRTHR